MNNKGSYPQQAVYPQQSTAPIYPPAMQVPPPPQAPPYSDAPPAYSEIYQSRYMHPPQAPGQLPQMTTAYPATQMYMPMAQTVPVGAMAPNIPMAYYPMGPVYPPGSTVLVDGGYDAGARFGHGTPASIPPPPPGHAPNAAQLAAMQGANVVMAQRKNNFFMGGSSGGYTIW
ncbi:DAZ-associated protein 2 [Brachyhypopomus gauderio]|uniref:DAZ-associated protein 2 n=1 Tax=Brachyhypopomus gauderio TaxID=698409 RepID=UPI004042DBF7